MSKPMAKQALPAELTAEQLARLTGKTWRTIRDRLKHLAPARVAGRHRYFRPAEALPLIYEAPDAHAMRARLDKARAEKTELEVAERKGKLLDVDVVTQHVVKRITNMKQHLLGIPTKAAPLVLGCKTLPQVREVLDDEIRRALEELAEMTGPAPRVAPGKPRPPASAAPVDGASRPKPA